MWQRQIQLALVSGKCSTQRRRLRIVDDHEVVLVLELRGVHRVVAAEDVLLRGRQAVHVALESVVDRLRDAEELVVALDDPPLDVEPDVLEADRRRL